METQYHYQVIRRALKIIDQHETEPLGLTQLAKALDMSPAHFQRLFSQWVGVSPKRYQQYLQMDHAKTLLRNKATTFETALSLGLSGISRLHDMFITWEAMSPGYYAKQSHPLRISYAKVGSPFGDAVVMATDRGICGIGFLDDLPEAQVRDDLMARWPSAEFYHNNAEVTSLAQDAFGGVGSKLHIMGGPFQIKVWEALLSIPSGHVSTYSDIANAIGNPKAVRAVGTAIGKNPVSWLIPCHRALRKSGELGGYHWGIPVKRALIAFESARDDAENPSISA